MKTTPISNLHKHLILDAVQDARSALRDATKPEAPDDTRSAATSAIGFLDWANDLILRDEHDSLLSLRLGGVTVTLTDLAPTVQDGTDLRAAAKALHLASCLLFSARRERDLDGRLRDILDHADDIDADKTRKHLEGTRQAIARLARA
jgi:hypothetical protein